MVLLTSTVEVIIFDTIMVPILGLSAAHVHRHPHVETSGRSGPRQAMYETNVQHTICVGRMMTDHLQGPATTRGRHLPDLDLICEAACPRACMRPKLPLLVYPTTTSTEVGAHMILAPTASHKSLRTGG